MPERGDLMLVKKGIDRILGIFGACVERKPSIYNGSGACNEIPYES